MFPPLYNDEFRARIEGAFINDDQTYTEVLASMVNPAYVITDSESGRRRPALHFLPQLAEDLDVKACEVLHVIVSDVLHEEGVFSAADFLDELIIWIVMASPGYRAMVLGGYATNERMRAEDRWAMLQQEHRGPNISDFAEILGDLSGLGGGEVQA